MRRSSSWWLGAAVVLAGVSGASLSFAYCRTTTCDGCVQPINGCVQDGHPLYWVSGCVSYNLQRDSSAQVPLSVATTLAARSFSHWSTAVCPTSGRPPSLTFLDLGPVACDEVEYNDPNSAESPRTGGNANILMFRDTAWDESKSADPTATLALTTVTFSRSTGQIFDADIEVNGNKVLSTSDAPSQTAYDLESILTHEIGHFLGLAHSQQGCSGNSCPTMTASYVKGSSAFRNLEADDIAGLCAIYPSNRSADTSSCVPVHGLGSECGVAAPRQGGCSVGPASAKLAEPRVIHASLACVGAALAALRLRRPRRRRAG